MYTTPKKLVIPEKCRLCPAICVIKVDVDKSNQHIEGSTEFAMEPAESNPFIKPAAETSGLDSSAAIDLLDGLKQARRPQLAVEMAAADDEFDSNQSDVDELTEECEGPLTLKGQTALGRLVTVTVCGSENFDQTSRYLTLQGHGQTQHEQAHVERDLTVEDILAEGPK